MCAVSCFSSAALTSAAPGPSPVLSLGGGPRPGPPDAQGAGARQPWGLERYSAMQRGEGSQGPRGAAGGGAPTEPSLSVFQAGAGVEFYKHKCQSSESSANTLWKLQGKRTKGLEVDPGQGRAAGSEVRAPSSSLTVDTAGGGVGAEGAQELSNLCCLLLARVWGLRDTHRHTHRHRYTYRDTHRQT